MQDSGNTWFDIIGMIEKLQRSFLILQKFYKTHMNLLYKFFNK
jgi:hypothetical protein